MKHLSITLCLLSVLVLLGGCSGAGLGTGFQGGGRTGSKPGTYQSKPDTAQSKSNTAQSKSSTAQS